MIGFNRIPSIPDSIKCNEENCNYTYYSNIDLNCSGSVDSDSDMITYYIDKGKDSGETTTWIQIGSHNESTTLTWDISGETPGNTYDKLRCSAIDHNGTNMYRNYHFENVNINLQYKLNEEEAGSEISNILNQELNNADIYEYAYITTINKEGRKDRGIFDRYAQNTGNAWALNYITGTEQYENLNPFYTAIRFWEEENMTTLEIETSVVNFINGT